MSVQVASLWRQFVHGTNKDLITLEARRAPSEGTAGLDHRPSKSIGHRLICESHAKIKQCRRGNVHMFVANCTDIAATCQCRGQTAFGLLSASEGVLAGMLVDIEGNHHDPHTEI